MHLVFLGLYAFVVLFSFHKSWPSNYELVLLCWIGVIIVDEIRQVSIQLARLCVLSYLCSKIWKKRVFEFLLILSSIHPLPGLNFIEKVRETYSIGWE